MINLCLITSVINPSKNPLSYISSRSVFDASQRFDQTLKTIMSIKERISNVKIFLIETSELSDEQEKIIGNMVDYYLNLINDDTIRNRTSSISKSMGEGTQTIKAIEYIFNEKIEFDNFFKISGRYWLNDKFNFDNYLEDKIIYKKISDNNYNTCFYKLNKKYLKEYHQYLINCENDFINCKGFEVLFSKFVDNLENKEISVLGIEGFVSVCGTFYQG